MFLKIIINNTETTSRKTKYIVPYRIAFGTGIAVSLALLDSNYFRKYDYLF